jgi:single-strand DNA-binding protein
MSVNKVILIGYLGNSPEIRVFPQTKARYAVVSVATTESWKDKATGERKSKTEWHNVTILNEMLVNFAENSFHKGSKVYVEGQIKTSEFTDKNGNKKTTISVVVPPYKGDIQLLDRPAQTQSAQPKQNYSRPDEPSFIDDELPF